MSGERNEENALEELETEAEKKERWRSIYIVYFTMFLMSLGFSIILTGVWPYLDKVKTNHSFMLCQLILYQDK